MEKQEEDDIFSTYGLDENDPFIEGFVLHISTAIGKLFEAFKKKMQSSVAFNVFVNAWEYYNNMPPLQQTKCAKLLEACQTMWNDVTKSEAERFSKLCMAVVQGGKGQCKKLVTTCNDIIEAIFALNGKLPEAERIFDAAHAAAMSGKVESDTCMALLYIVCARIWYLSFGYSSSEEEKMLSEGIRHHQKAKEKSNFKPSRLYSLHVISAIYDSSYVKQSKEQPDDEIIEFVNSAYDLLPYLDPVEAEIQKEELFKLTGIPASNSANRESLFPFQYPAKGLPN